jgi:CheY-like chemotaxis protein
MPTILVVDDEIIILEMLQDVLEEEGYQVVTAGDGHAGLARLAEAQPHLVLSDVMMPGMDGRELCLQLHSDPRYRSIPIVLMSAALPPRRNDYRYAAFIPKPFDLDFLMATISRIIGSTAREHG